MTDYSVWQRCQGARADGMRCCRRGRSNFFGYAYFCVDHMRMARIARAREEVFPLYPRAVLGSWRPGRRPANEQ